MNRFIEARNLFTAFEKDEDLNCLAGAVEIIEEILDGEDTEASQKALNLFNAYKENQIEKAKSIISIEAHMAQYKKQWDILNEFVSIAEQKELKMVMNELFCKESAILLDELIKDSVRYQTTGKGQDPAGKVDYFVKNLSKRFWKEED